MLINGREHSLHMYRNGKRGMAVVPKPIWELISPAAQPSPQALSIALMVPKLSPLLHKVSRSLRCQHQVRAVRVAGKEKKEQGAAAG